MKALRARHFRAWWIPALYTAAALAAGLTLPALEMRVFPRLVSPVTVPEATAIYSAIASGTIALTGIVFSLVFVMVQFGATAYSPRLVPMIARDELIPHALGVFAATFLYAIAATAGVDYSASGHVPVVSFCVVIALLVATMAMLIGLVQRVGLFQVSRVLRLMGDEGREAIARTYLPFESSVGVAGGADLPAGGRTQTVVHHGPPRWIQAVDAAALVNVATESGVFIEMVAAVGDPVVESIPVLHVYGGRQTIDEPALMGGIELGEERTFERDPAYAIRLLVDIAIRALSPAVNDPTTAVQALDQIEDLLIRLSGRQLERSAFRDGNGVVRRMVPSPAWVDLLRLALDEICACGATSVQVMRRMAALISALSTIAPEERRSSIREWEARVQLTVARSFASADERSEASTADRQGLGAPRADHRSPHLT
jgi:uncharacterized membrane protein